MFKTALLTLIQTVALENTDASLTANAVLPATMYTLVKPQDVASLVLWLADGSTRHVTGAAIPIGASHG